MSRFPNEIVEKTVLVTVAAGIVAVAKMGVCVVTVAVKVLMYMSYVLDGSYLLTRRL